MKRQDAISKRHISIVNKFNEELKAFAKYTGDEEAILYEDANTSFTLSNVRVEDGYLIYEYDGREDSEDMIVVDEDGEAWERETDGIAEWVKFWRGCLRRAKRYYSMDTDKLDAIQDGAIEDTEED